MKTIRVYLAWIFYRLRKQDEELRYLLAQEKGCYCESVDNGVATFDPNRKPQKEPYVAEFKDFKSVWMKRDEAIKTIKKGELIDKLRATERRHEEDLKKEELENEWDQEYGGACGEPHLMLP